MRISNQMVMTRVLSQIAHAQQRLSQVQERVGSGLRINRPADDPIGTGQIMSARTALERNRQYQRNIVIATGELGATEAALTGLSDLLQRVSELSVQAANDTLGAGDRASIALEVSQLISEAMRLGNARYLGRSIFGGHQTDIAPYVSDDPDTPMLVSYMGDTGLHRREISEGMYVAANITGDRVLPGMFATLIQFREALVANDVTAINAAIGTVSAELDAVVDLRSEVGAKVRRIEMAEVGIKDEEVMVRAIVSRIEDADLAESIVELRMQETAYEAALGSAVRTLSLSILDFLR